MDGHCQKGLVSVCHIDDYLNDLIKKHEKTRPQKEDDRTKLNATLSAHPGPVFLTYRDDESINTQVEAITQEAPLFDFTAPDGVQHTVWRVTETSGLVEAFAAEPGPAGEASTDNDSALNPNPEQQAASRRSKDTLIK